MQTEQLPRDGDFASFAEFSRDNRAFPEGSLRWLRFNEATNGLAEAGAFVQVGRRVLIDKPKFFAWLRGQRSNASLLATGSVRRSRTAPSQDFAGRVPQPGAVKVAIPES